MVRIVPFSLNGYFLPVLSHFGTSRLKFDLHNDTWDVYQIKIIHMKGSRQVTFLVLCYHSGYCHSWRSWILRSTYIVSKPRPLNILLRSCRTVWSFFPVLVSNDPRTDYLNPQSNFSEGYWFLRPWSRSHFYHWRRWPIFYYVFFFSYFLFLLMTLLNFT